MTKTTPEARETYEPARTERAERADRGLRFAGMLACEVFAAFSLVRALHRGEADNALSCFLAMLLVQLPGLAERLLHCRMRTDIYLLGVCYALGSMIGDAWFFYERVAWWDKFLHLLGGFYFAVLGAYLPRLMLKDSGANPFVLCAVFAFCFSVAVSALWEFYEYGVDQLFALDMQRDTVISAISSHLLDDTPGGVGTIENITSVIVNGQELGGYIDVGLRDTMGDMLIETLGALVYAVSYLLGKGERPALTPDAQPEAAVDTF